MEQLRRKISFRGGKRSTLKWTERFSLTNEEENKQNCVKLRAQLFRGEGKIMLMMNSTRVPSSLVSLIPEACASILEPVSTSIITKQMETITASVAGLTQQWIHMTLARKINEII